MATAIRPVDRSVRFIMASLRLLVEAEGGLAFRRRMSFVEPRAPVNLTLAFKRQQSNARPQPNSRGRISQTMPVR